MYLTILIYSAQILQCFSPIVVYWPIVTDNKYEIMFYFGGYNLVTAVACYRKIWSDTENLNDTIKIA